MKTPPPESSSAARHRDGAACPCTRGRRGVPCTVTRERLGGSDEAQGGAAIGPYPNMPVPLRPGTQSCAARCAPQPQQACATRRRRQGLDYTAARRLLLLNRPLACWHRPLAHGQVCPLPHWTGYCAQAPTCRWEDTALAGNPQHRQQQQYTWCPQGQIPQWAAGQHTAAPQSWQIHPARDSALGPLTAPHAAWQKASNGRSSPQGPAVHALRGYDSRATTLCPHVECWSGTVPVGACPVVRSQWAHALSQACDLNRTRRTCSSTDPSR